MNGYALVLSDSKIIISGLGLVLKENEIPFLVKSGTIPGYELTVDMDELFIKDKDLDRARPIIVNYKKQIQKI